MTWTVPLSIVSIEMGWYTMNAMSVFSGPRNVKRE